MPPLVYLRLTVLGVSVSLVLFTPLINMRSAGEPNAAIINLFDMDTYITPGHPFCL